MTDPTARHRTTGRGAGRRRSVAGLGALLVVLLAAGVWLAVLDHQAGIRHRDRADALRVAQQAATDLTTISSATVGGQLDALAAIGTDSFKQQIGGFAPRFQTMLRQANITSTGTVSAAGLEQFGAATATAVVAVSTVASGGGAKPGQAAGYQLLISLRQEGARWLVSRVEVIR